MNSINREPSAKSIYVWNIIGSGCNALLSVALLMLVTRMNDDAQADIFSLGWSISQLMATIATFQIRTYQATDIKKRFSFAQYLEFRIITILVMLISSYIYIISRGYTGKKAVIILVLCLYRAFDSLSDVYEGDFQQKERLDLAGKALTYRIVIGSIAFGSSLYISRNLLASCVILMIAYGISFFAYNVRYNLCIEKIKEKIVFDANIKWIIQLTMEGAPLFINAFLMNAIMNAPKMYIDSAISDGMIKAGSQTIFNILFMPASVLNLVYIVFRPMLTKMAIAWEGKKKNNFLKILFKILGGLLGMTFFVIIGCWILGIPILTLIYGIDLHVYRLHLLLIVIGGCLYTFAAVFDNALVVLRKQHILAVSYVITWIYVKVVVKILIEQWYMLGAAMAYLTSMILFITITVVMFIYFYKKENKIVKKK